MLGENEDEDFLLDKERFADDEESIFGFGEVSSEVEEGDNIFLPSVLGERESNFCTVELEYFLRLFVNGEKDEGLALLLHPLADPPLVLLLAVRLIPVKLDLLLRDYYL